MKRPLPRLWKCLAPFWKSDSKLRLAPVEVHVLLDGERCTVVGQQMDCAVVGSYLRDTLHIPFDHLIVVSVDGPRHSETPGKRVKAFIRSMGYKKVTTEDFITKPGGNEH